MNCQTSGGEPAIYLLCMYLTKVTHLSAYFHLQNRVNNYTHITGLLRELNELFLINRSEQESVMLPVHVVMLSKSGGYYYYNNDKTGVILVTQLIGVAKDFQKE